MLSKLIIRNLSMLTLLCVTHSALAQSESRHHAREAGVVVGVFQTEELNAITDVEGVRVGHTTLIESDDIRTGVTAIIPASGNLYTHPIPDGVHTGNDYGKWSERLRCANLVKSKRRFY